MNIGVVCLDNIEFYQRNWGISSVDEKNNVISKLYRINDNKVNVIYLNLKSNNLRGFKLDSIIKKNNVILIIIREMNEKNIEIVNCLISETKGTLIIGKDNRCEKLDELSILNNSIYFSNLIYDKKINLELLIEVICKLEILSKLKQSKSKINIIIERKNTIGELALAVLEKFKEIQNNRVFDIYVFSRNEISLSELIYLEDPIREYIENEDILTIHNFRSEKINENEYSLILLSR